MNGRWVPIMPTRSAYGLVSDAMRASAEQLASNTKLQRSVRLAWLAAPPLSLAVRHR